MKFIHRLNRNFLQLDLRYFFRNSFYNILAYAISIVCTLLITYLIANKISSNDTGIYRYIYSWYGIISGVMLSGITTSLTISIAKGYNSLRSAFFYKAFCSIFGVCASLVVAGYYFYNDNSTLSIGFILLGLSIPLLELSGLYSSYLQGREDFKKASTLTIFNKISTLLLMLIFIYILHYTNSHSLLISNVFLVGITQTVYVYSLAKKDKERQNIPAKHLNKKDPTLLPYAIHLTLMGVIFTIGQQADKLILFSMFGSTTLAAYWIATTIPLEAQRFIAQITTIYIPKLVRADTGSLVFKKKFIRTVLIATMILCIGCGLYWISAPMIFSYLFPKYIAYTFISQIFFLNIILIPSIFSWSFFLLQGNIKKTYLYHVADPLIQISLYVVFIILFGSTTVMPIIYAILAKNVIMAILGLTLFINTKPSNSSISHEQLV